MAPATGRPLLFGEVLFDQFPDGARVLGGAPFNVAWHLRALGLAPWVVSRVGTDGAGDEILAAMGAWDLDPSGIQRDPRRPTGQVRVQLAEGQPRFEILPDQAYDAISLPDADALPAVALLYHGSLALREPTSRHSLATLRARSIAPVLVDVNLRTPWWERTAVDNLLDGARWCKLNQEELVALVGLGDPLPAARRLLGRHSLAGVFVTLGGAGAAAVTADGFEDVQPAPQTELADTVGAGDAFAAVLVAGLLQDWPLPLILGRAQQLAAAVCGLRGAVAPDPGFYEGFRSDWGTG